MAVKIEKKKKKFEIDNEVEKKSSEFAKNNVFNEFIRYIYRTYERFQKKGNVHVQIFYG